MITILFSMCNFTFADSDEQNIIKLIKAEIYTDIMKLMADEGLSTADAVEKFEEEYDFSNLKIYNNDDYRGIIDNERTWFQQQINNNFFLELYNRTTEITQNDIDMLFPEGEEQPVIDDEGNTTLPSLDNKLDLEEIKTRLAEWIQEEVNGKESKEEKLNVLSRYQNVYNIPIWVDLIEQKRADVKTDDILDEVDGIIQRYRSSLSTNEGATIWDTYDGPGLRWIGKLDFRYIIGNSVVSF